MMTPYVSYALSTEEKISRKADFARNTTARSIQYVPTSCVRDTHIVWPCSNVVSAEETTLIGRVSDVDRSERGYDFVA